MSRAQNLRQDMVSFLVVFLSFSRLLEEYLKLGCDCDLPYPLQVFYSLTSLFTKLHNMRYRRRR